MFDRRGQNGKYKLRRPSWRSWTAPLLMRWWLRPPWAHRRRPSPSLLWFDRLNAASRSLTILYWKCWLSMRFWCVVPETWPAIVGVSLQHAVGKKTSSRSAVKKRLLRRQRRSWRTVSISYQYIWCFVEY